MCFSLQQERHRAHTEDGLVEIGPEEVPGNCIPIEPGSLHGRTSPRGDVLGDNDMQPEVYGNPKKLKLSRLNGPMNIEELLYEYPTCPPSAYKQIREM